MNLVYIYNSLILFYIFLISVAIIYKIRSFWLAFIVISINIIVIISAWIFKVKNEIRNVNHECIFKLNKKWNMEKIDSGIFYKSCIDYWHIFHILLYILIGILYPNQYILITILSILWELFEHYSFKYIVLFCSDPICGRLEDVFLNIIGYIIGNLLSRI